MRRAAVAINFSSSGECTCARSDIGMSNPRRITAAEVLRNRTAGRTTAMNTSIGGATATASASARRNASDFGTSSPTTT